MRFTSASFLGLLVVAAPLGTIADNALPTDISSACALLANLTPEQFATTLADLENKAKTDITRDQAQVDKALAQIESLPAGNLQAEVDKVCASQAKAVKIGRSRISRRQIGGALDALSGSLPGGLGNTVKGGDDSPNGGALDGLLGSVGTKKGRSENTRRQDVGDLGSKIEGFTQTLGSLAGGVSGETTKRHSSRQEDEGLFGGILIPGIL
ncbi:predicted protein [Histoplasma capsulatum G186AR]|uniref:Cell wall protein n=2 Tax=Ajellomyces capsulatus TaxID=5037 RepID=C0NT03_AJECG|nr:uncharacterized protein HCBG_06283 [Histoplasma capsulatum G186AR]EEH05164.1 predicted protein [Histoplasma capsulatum G186AR]KAG5305472.1 hypothetical protein I7I52_04146 [Histoplasma capsulatum]QSS76434.1 hypothetical protein I7I50_05887 [Histoplasma capsulatum G186AR]